MKVMCQACGSEFEAQRRTAKFCDATCRQRARRGCPPPEGGSDFEAATRRELERLGRLDTMLGQQALVISRRMANSAETGSAVATLSKEHSRLMAAASQGEKVPDQDDEVRVRRERKREAARQAPR